MNENVYGAGRPVVGRGRLYCVKAGCRIEISLWARSEEEAEKLFYGGAGSLEDAMDHGTFDVLEITEAEEPY